MDSEKLKGLKDKAGRTSLLVDDLFQVISELGDNVSLFEFYAALKNIGSPVTMHLAGIFLESYKEWERKKR